jgi:hypothetical protein
MVNLIRRMDIGFVRIYQILSASKGFFQDNEFERSYLRIIAIGKAAWQMN